MNQFTDAELDPRPWATFKRNHPFALPSARRRVLPPHCLAVMVGAFRGRSLVPAGGEPFNTAAHGRWSQAKLNELSLEIAARVPVLECDCGHPEHRE